MDILLLIAWCTLQVPVEFILRSGIANHRVCASSTLLDSNKLFSKVFVPVDTPTGYIASFYSSAFSPTLGIVRVFKFC